MKNPKTIHLCTAREVAKERNEMKIKVRHPNGYSGILYGKSSLAIYDNHGIEVIHTGYRTINTEKELYDVLEKFPEIMKEFLKKMDHDLLYGKDGEQDGAD